MYKADIITLTLYTQLYAKCRHNDGLEWAAAQASNADIATQKLHTKRRTTQGQRRRLLWFLGVRLSLGVRLNTRWQHDIAMLTTESNGFGVRCLIS